MDCYQTGKLSVFKSWHRVLFRQRNGAVSPSLPSTWLIHNDQAVWSPQGHFCGKEKTCLELKCIPHPWRRPSISCSFRPWGTHHATTSQHGAHRCLFWWLTTVKPRTNKHVNCEQSAYVDVTVPRNGFQITKRKAAAKELRRLFCILVLCSLQNLPSMMPITPIHPSRFEWILRFYNNFWHLLRMELFLTAAAVPVCSVDENLDCVSLLITVTTIFVW